MPVIDGDYENACFRDGVKFLTSQIIEGYKSDDPEDPGKRTIFGISAKYHPEDVALMWDMPKKEALEKAHEIYFQKYWKEIRKKTPWCMPLNVPIYYATALMLFDCAVLHSVGRAEQFGNIAHESAQWLPSVFDRLIFLRLSYNTQNSKEKHLRGHLKRISRWLNEIELLIRKPYRFNKKDVELFFHEVSAMNFKNYIK